MKPRHILLTSDLSEEALRAFAPAGELARAAGAKITLFHVVLDLTDTAPQGGMLGTPIGLPDYESERRAAEHTLERQARILPPDVDATVRVVAGGRVARTIVEFAEEHGVDLIAMSTHGRSGARRLVLGSIAEGVLRHARVPVLCFPPPREAED